MSIIKTGSPENRKHKAIVILAMAASLIGLAFYVDKDALSTQLEIIIGIFVLGSLAIAWKDFIARPISSAEGKRKHIATLEKLFEFSLQSVTLGFLWVLSLIASAYLDKVWPLETAFLLSSVYAAICWRRSRERQKIVG